MSFDWLAGTVGLLIGLLLGRWWAGAAIWTYVASKRPDEHGFRTGMWLRNGVYYVVTGAEYSRVTGQPDRGETDWSEPNWREIGKGKGTGRPDGS
jgi:hypothetical protein